ncbi:uncharacterized protein IUM83_17672 [Phytophthora cinnamomi]|uniref:uncharacterized protein n=1 Tax=Phytophthora cinnamomi TaxID=4785 RepID=UPI00355A19E5|nr:hypothetical protein IUM83_17672 [Phytophthora cinnamomi]
MSNAEEMSNSEMSSFLQLVDSDSLDAILNCDEIAPSVQVTTSQLHQAMLSPAPLPEPDFGVSPSDDHENDEVFQAALELLDEAYDTASERGHQLNQPPKFSAEGKDASCTVEFEAGSSLGKAANATTKGQRRISTKQHIDQLRDTVNELTSQLHSLESGFTRAQIVESGDRSADSRGSVWQHIATRQLERRLEAEKDNARLRTMLDIQVQEAKSLRRLLKRRKKIEMMEKMLGLKRQKLPVIDKNGDKDGASFAILKEMLRNTDEAYIDIDREFASKAMDQVPCPGKTREENRCAMNDVFLEIMEKQLVPFTVKRTERAVWDALGQVGMQTLQCVKDIDAQVDFYAQNRQETDDTLMISYVAATAGFRGSESRTIRIRKVMRNGARRCSGGS